MGNTSYKHSKKDDYFNSRLIEQAYGSDISHRKVEHNHPITNNLTPTMKNWVPMDEINREERKGFRL
ncbi:MAG: hypothetical protein KID00_15675 [Clostridium argentinense]|uniref:Uncharacterized protein n=1 Tax=Clostridium faecium TaxID=2762223 RepID=A0ABR8YU37_9CLOT|nr:MULTISPECIES: hypothetical protein [Clostridium]MBD8047652.1 hypothetical protein [Clostridium faecium]MBS5825257.1 hypothetical protein [Clostridium argentinense]MDU1350791.1 hypothetical protein [Clostridium argentinense]